MGEAEQTNEAQHPSKTALKISERYGVPPQEVDALITDRSVNRNVPHPMTIGALMKDDNSKGSRMAQPQSSWTPATVVGIVLGILGILAIATLLVFLVNWNKESKQTLAPPVRDTVIVNLADVAPAADTMAPASAMPESNVVPAPVTHAARRPRTARPVLSTSNSLEAEERLAELKAAGNRKARIVRVTRRGTTLYQVRK